VSKQARGKIEITKWDEQPIDEVEGQVKMTRATVTGSIHGDIEGSGTTHYLMVYREDESAGYVLVQRVIGSLGGRSGGFVLEGSGAYADGVARGTWSIVPGTGTGDLAGISGRGDFEAPAGSTMTFTLEYELG
jgi:hypothetical protein